MTKQEFLEHCLNTYGTSPDYPFDEDFETAALRHTDNRKWYAIVMCVSRCKFGFDRDEVIDVVNLKLPAEMLGSNANPFPLREKSARASLCLRQTKKAPLGAFLLAEGVGFEPTWAFTQTVFKTASL